MALVSMPIADRENILAADSLQIGVYYYCVLILGLGSTHDAASSCFIRTARNAV